MSWGVKKTGYVRWYKRRYLSRRRETSCTNVNKLTGVMPQNCEGGSEAGCTNRLKRLQVCVIILHLTTSTICVTEDRTGYSIMNNNFNFTEVVYLSCFQSVCVTNETLAVLSCCVPPPPDTLSAFIKEGLYYNLGCHGHCQGNWADAWEDKVFWSDYRCVACVDGCPP